MGAKAKLSPWIISHFPEHSLYVEVFGGSGGVLLNKEKSQQEVINDKWDDLVHMFVTLRDRGEELKEYLTYTPVSHTIFDEWMEKLLITKDFSSDIERAAIVFYGLCLRYAGDMTSAAWSGRRENNMAGVVKRKVDNLLEFVDRIRDVTIENLDFRDCIKAYDRDYTFFYFDPPYKIEKDGKRYLLNFEYRDHRDLARLVFNLKAKCILSYYPCDLVDELYPKDEYYFAEKKVVKQSATVARGKEKPIGTELLIMNFDPAKTPKFKGVTGKSLGDVFG